MNIMTLDTTKKQASISLQINEKVVIEKTKENDTHSESLLPKINEMLTEQNTTIKDIDVYGMLIGPGSFTGIRISVSMVKAFLFNTQKKCVSVNSFELLAYNIQDKKAGFFVGLSADGRGAYVAEFNEKNTLKRYDWITLAELNNLCKISGLPLFIKAEEEAYFDELTVSKNLVIQKDNSLLELVKQKIKNNEFVDKKELEPLYIRLSQAEDQYQQNLLGKIVIKNANLSSLDELEILEEEIFKEEAYKKESLKEELTRDDRVVIIATLNEKIIGYVMLLKTPDNLLNIIKIAVTPSYQKLKVATKLFEQVINLKKENGYDKIFLEVNEHNKAAIAFYKKMGFTETHKRQKYYKNGDSAIVMTL